MAFIQGSKGAVPARTTQGSYVATGSITYIQCKHITNVIARPLQGSYVSSGASTYGYGTHIQNTEARASACLVFTNPPAIFPYIGVHCQFQGLPQVLGDDSRHISFGQIIDFSATPRYGFDPLTVQFTNKSTGAIKKYYWLFGDGHRSYYSDPSHIYHRGVYTVTLEIKVGIRTLTLRKRKYITVLSGGLVVSRTTRCIRHTILPEQGIGFYEMPAEAMAMPEAGVGAIAVYDTNNQIRGLVLDARTGKWYDVTTRDGPSDTGIQKYWTGIDGNEFDHIIKFREDRGTDEKDFQRLLESHVYLRPISELNRNQTGYDENGYPDGMEIDLAFFNDGEPTTASATVIDIPLNGDIKSDRKIEGNRVQMQVTVNRGAHIILNRLNIYDSSKRAAPPDKRVMTEMDNQEELAQSVFWASYYNGVLVNRYDGVEISLSGITPVEGPVDDDQLTGSAFSAPITLGSIAITSGSILFWLEGTAVLTIGGSAVTLTDIGTSNGYTLKYGSVSMSGSIILTPTGPAKISDFRVFNSALSTVAKNYYLNDVQDNAGGNVLP